MTDTERLDWVMLYQPRFDHDEKGWYMVFWRDNRFSVARGNGRRQCIDNAVSGNCEVIS
jgi:hypothetical protein